MPPRGRPSSSHSSHSHSSHSHSSYHPHSSHSSSSHHHRSSYSSHHHTPLYSRRRHRSRFRSYGGYGSGYGYGGSGCSLPGCVGTLAALALIVIIAGGALYFNSKRGDSVQQGGNAQSGYHQQQAETQDSIYVEPLKRSVKWSEQYECYYDQPTDSYFFKNTEVSPAIWQYWFEGISSDYGDFGWMEWDVPEQRWYVQIGEYDWEPLPESKYTSSMWHFD